MNRITRSLITIAALAFSGLSIAAEPIKIGAVAPKTGPLEMS